MLQNASGLARGIVLGVTAFALIVVCLKLFCCRKVQGEMVNSSDPGDGDNRNTIKGKSASTSIEMTNVDEEDPDRRVKARGVEESHSIVED